jgi:hypothetical protein
MVEINVVTQQTHVFGSVLFGSIRHELVEDMVATLQGHLRNDTSLLQQIGLDISTSQLSGRSEMDTDELTETGRVVITGCLGVSERLKDGIGLDDLVFKGYFLGGGFAGSGDVSEVGNNLLGVLSFSGSRLSSNQDGLILMILQHVLVGSLSNGKNVRWNFISPLALVDLHGSGGVNGESDVGIHGDTEKAGVGVDEISPVSLPQVVEDRSIVQEGQVGHVFAFEVLGGIDLTHEIFLVGFFRSVVFDGDEISLCAGDGTDDEALSFMGDPAGGLGIVRLALILSLLFHGDEKELGRVGLLSRREFLLNNHLDLLSLWTMTSKQQI